MGDDKQAARWRPPSLAETVELHGLRHACAQRSPIARRVCWWLVILVMTAFMGFSIASSVLLYLSYPRSDVTYLRHQQSLPFPRVTICNWNRAQASALLRDNGNPAASSFPNVFPDVLWRDPGTNWAAAYVKYAQPIDEALVSCMFMGETCSASDFELVPTQDGICYAFKSGVARSINRTGSSHGLEVELTAQTEEYLDVTVGWGFKVHVTDPDKPVVTSEGVTITPGRMTRLDIKRTSILHLAAPYGDCRDDVSGDCDLECLTSEVVNSCDCRLVYMNSSSASVCDPTREQTCTQSILQNGCAERCPVPCSEVLYDYSKDETNFRETYFNDVANVNPGTTAQEWTKNLVQLSVFYGRISEQVTESQAAYSLTDFMTSIGVVLLIYLGCSLMTLVEFIDYAFWHLICCRRKE